MALKMTRAKFEQLVGDLVERTLAPCQTALNDAGLTGSEIDEVVLVGGSTRMPLVQEKVTAFFGKEPHKGVNPDEVVAVGAAVQGGVLAGEVSDVLLLDVTPLSLGIETLGGVMTKLIEKNTTIPTKRSQVFSTAADSQPQVEIRVLQGEREMAETNRELGRFILDGIPPAPRGTPQIEVTFDIDANGILSVGAEDKASGKEQSIRIEGSGGLSKDEIEGMVKDAESHASEDQARRESIEKRNELDTIIYSGEKMLSDNGDKLSAEDRTRVEEAIAAAKVDLESGDAAKLEAAKKSVEGALHSVAEALYKAEAASADGEAPGGDEAPGADASDKSGDGDDVIDAEYSEDKGSPS